MNRYYSFLWHSTDNLPSYSKNQYSAEDVFRLRRGIERHDPDGRLIMFSDEHYAKACEEAGAEEVILFSGKDCGGWSRMLEPYSPANRPGGKTRHVLLGLDTVIMKNPSWLFKWDKSPIGMPLDPCRAPDCCDAVLTIDQVGCGITWAEYRKHAPSKMRAYRLRNMPSEMMLLRALFERHKWTPIEKVPRRLASYKMHIAKRRIDWKVPDIIYFHGRPKPADLPDDDPVKLEWLR